MTYTGHVEPGGAAEVRELPRLVISKLSVGPLDNNAYLLRDRDSGRQLLIDAADEPDRLLDMIGPDGLTAVVTTHAHPDHFRALDDVVRATGALSYAGALDAGSIDPMPGRLLDDGDAVTFGATVLSVIHLRGHTAGSVALVYDDPMGHTHLFTGDSLFPGGPGRTTTPEEFDSLMADLQSKVFDRLPDETWFYPGHGDDSTLGAERVAIPEWLGRRW